MKDFYPDAKDDIPQNTPDPRDESVKLTFSSMNITLEIKLPEGRR